MDSLPQDNSYHSAPNIFHTLIKSTGRSAYRLMVHYSSNRTPDPALVPASTGRTSVSRRKMG